MIGLWKGHPGKAESLTAKFNTAFTSFANDCILFLLHSIPNVFMSWFFWQTAVGCGHRCNTAHFRHVVEECSVSERVLKVLNYKCALLRPLYLIGMGDTWLELSLRQTDKGEGLYLTFKPGNHSFTFHILSPQDATHDYTHTHTHTQTEAHSFFCEHTKYTEAHTATTQRSWQCKNINLFMKHSSWIWIPWQVEMNNTERNLRSQKKLSTQTQRPRWQSNITMTHHLALSSV